MKKRNTIFAFIFVIILISLLSITAYATSSSVTSNHSVYSSADLTSSEACSSLNWIDATYNWIKGGLFAADKCKVFMQTAGITSGQTNSVTVSVWHDGMIYEMNEDSSAKMSVMFTVKGKLWVAVERVQADFDASYVALGNQHWTVIGD